jgi:hypothetical protein
MKSTEEFKAFDALVGRVLAVSHEEIKRRENDYRKTSRENPKRRGPKRKITSASSDHEAMSES